MAELSGLPVPTMDWGATDPIQAMKQFKALCTLMFKGPLKEKSEQEKVAYLQIWSGAEGIELVSTWSLSNTDQNKLETYWEKFEAYVAPKSNFRIARFKLRALKQQNDESIDSFVKRIRILAAECKFSNSNEQIVDTLIFGTCSRTIQSKLIQKDNSLTLDQALDIARTEEATQLQISDMTNTTVHALTNHRPNRSTSKPCLYCGTQHPPVRSSCPASGTTCSKCGKRNHWAIVCRSLPQPNPNNSNFKSQQTPGRRHRVHTLQAEDMIDTASISAGEPLIPHDVPKRPWHKLGIDLFYLRNENYLLLADYGSKFPIVKKLKTTSSREVINRLKEIFSEHGIPETLISDNGPQFSAAEFKEFAQEYGFDHTTSSPLYPQSNGFIERCVQTVKNIMKKCHDSRSDINMALLCLRTTPVSHDIPAPCMVLNNRLYKTNIPTASQTTHINWNPDSLESRQERQKSYHDKGAKDLSLLVPDQPVGNS